LFTIRTQHNASVGLAFVRIAEQLRTTYKCAHMSAL
jgi:hypothetical protein